MITSIQLSSETKSELEKLKNSKESYEDIIKKLLDEYRKENELNLLRESYIEMNDLNLKIAKEGEGIDDELWD